MNTYNIFGGGCIKTESNGDIVYTHLKESHRLWRSVKINDGDVMRIRPSIIAATVTTTTKSPRARTTRQLSRLSSLSLVASSNNVKLSYYTNNHHGRYRSTSTVVFPFALDRVYIVHI